MPEELAVGAVGDLLATDIGVGVASAGTAAATGVGEAGLAAGFDLLGGETAINAAGSAVPLAGGAELGAGGLGATALTGGGGGGGSPLDFNQSILPDASTAPGDFFPEQGANFALPAGTSFAPVTGASGFSFPSISQLGSGLNIASSLYGMSQADQLKKLAMLQANKATPWASAGGGDLAAQQLMALISGKTDVSTLPGYAAGKQAVERSGAANGWLGSGNMMAALSKFGGDFYNNAVTQLAELSGANFNPVSGGQLALTGATNSAATNLAAMSNINKTIETQPAWRA